MSAACLWYVVLLTSGLLMLGIEIFVPGGVVGFMGGLCLLAAAGVGFLAFGPDGGLLSAVAIVVFAGVAMILWIVLFPKTKTGRRMTLADDGKSFKNDDLALATLTGKEGVAQSALRPAGIALIDGQRVDVMTDGAWIEAGQKIKVLKVEGNLALVARL